MARHYPILLAFVLLELFFTPHFAAAWERIVGKAVDLSIAPDDGTVYVLGHKRVAGGWAVYKRTSSGWVELSGGGVAIAAGPEGIVWVIDERRRIFRYISGGWQQMSGKGRDIAVGADGSVFLTGATSCGSGYEVFRFIEPNGWAKMTGCGRKINVGPNGTPWVTNTFGQLFKYSGGGWAKMKGGAYDVAVGRGGDLWATGTSGCTGGRQIYHYVNDGWVKEDGCAVTIELAPDQSLWVVNNSGNIYRK